MLEGFDRHYRLFRAASQDAKRLFECADWHGQQQGQRVRIEFYDQRVDEAVQALQARFEVGSLSMDGVAADQAALHRAADRSSPARTRRDLLQFGHDQDPAPALLQERLHLRATGCLDRIHREPRTAGAADLSRVVPGQLRDARHLAHHRPQFRPARRVRRSGKRHRPRAGRGRHATGGLQAARQLPDPGAVEPVLPQQGRLPGRQDHQRLQGDTVRVADPVRRGRALHHRYGAVLPRTNC